MSARMVALALSVVAVLAGRNKIAALLTKLTGTWVGESR
jgi:hypothetical protein